MAKGWVVFNPNLSSVSTSSSCVIFTEGLFQVNWGCQGQKDWQDVQGTRVYTISGGTKYRATLVLNDNDKAGVTISAPGATYTYPAYKTTVIEWVSGNCTLSVSGVSFPRLPGYCYYSVIFERYVN